MSKRTFALIFTLFTIAIVLVMIALYNPSSYQSPSPTPAPTNTLEPLAQTELRFGNLSSFEIASSSGKKIGYSIPITISSRNNKITMIQLELNYDSQILTTISLIPGTFFPKPVSLLNKIDEKNGRISYAIGVGPNNPGVQGDGVVAILTFQDKSPLRKETNITFLPKTSVTAEGVNQTVLKKAASTQIVIGENNATSGGQIKNRQIKNIDK